MPSVFWTGELSPPIALLINASNALAFVTGGARDTAAMKRRIRAGYETEFTEDIANYDKVGREHYRYIAELLLSPLPLHRAVVAEIGCGTGIMSELLLERGVARLDCSDIAEYMLNKCRARLADSTAAGRRASFARLRRNARMRKRHFACWRSRWFWRATTAKLRQRSAAWIAKPCVIGFIAITPKGSRVCQTGDQEAGRPG